MSAPLLNALLVNADDAGLHRDTDDAILRCAAAGVLRNATVVASGPTAREFLRRAPHARLDPGLHFNLTEGRALAGPATTLTDAEGAFLGPKSAVWERAVAGGLDTAEVRAEIEAQLDAFRASGLEPSHVDGHNHVHLFPAVREALADLLPGAWFRTPVEPDCERKDLPDLGPAFWEWAGDRSGPWPRTEAFGGYGFCHQPSLETFLAPLKGDFGLAEIMVHPGRRPGSTFGSAPQRGRETDVLCSRGLGAALARRGIESMSYEEASSRCA